MEVATNTIVDLYKIPVHALKPKTRQILSCMLNKPKVLMSPEKLPRDYRGLADLMHISTLSFWFKDGDYIGKLLELWGKEENATLGKLQEFFEKIDRYDVLDDTMEMFVKDAIDFQQRDNIVELIPREDPDLIRDVLTVDDVYRVRRGHGVQEYDAFLLYVDEDRQFAEKCISFLESPPHCLHICDKDRDLIASITFEHSAIMELISKRCRRLIVILSEQFLRSDRHTFFVKFAQSLTYDKNVFKVIPVIYQKENLSLPDDLRPYHVLSLHRGGNFVNFWERLSSSITPRIKASSDSGIYSSELNGKCALNTTNHSNAVDNFKMIDSSTEATEYNVSNKSQSHLSSFVAKISSPFSKRIISKQRTNETTQTTSKSILKKLLIPKRKKKKANETVIACAGV